MSVQAPMHLRVLLGAFHPSCCLGNESFFLGLKFMLKDRIGTLFSFEAALLKKVVGKLIYVVTVGS